MSEIENHQATLSRRPLIDGKFGLLGVLAVAGAAAVVVAWLIIAGLWYFAAILIFALPVLVVIHRHPFVSVMIWLLLAPFLLHSNTATERYVYWAIHRALPMLTLLMMALSAGLHINQRRTARPGPAEAAMAGYVLISIASILWMNHQPVATFYLFYDRILVPMALYLIIRFAEPSERELRWLLAAAVFIVLSQGVIGILSQFAPGLIPSQWMENAGERTVGTLINAAIYTIALMFGGLVLAHAAQQREPVWLRRVYVLCFLLAMYGTFISFSRASWLGGMVVGLGLLLIYPRFILRLTIVLAPLVLLLAGVLLADQLEWAEERLYSAEAENSATSRVPIMVGAYHMFLVKPVTGWGYNNFDLYDRSFYGRLLDVAGDNKDHASHNYFLTILAEQGLPGLLLYLGPMFYWLIITARRYSFLPANGLRSRKLVLMLWLVILFHVIVSNFINMIVVYGLGIWWITLGLIGYLLESAGAPRPVTVPATRPAVGGSAHG